MPIKRVIVCFFLISQFLISAYASLEETDAAALANDFNIAITSATSVISGLQPAINTGAIYAERLDPDIILKDFYKTFKMKAGKVFDPDVAGLIGDYRKQMVTAISEVMQENKERILTGGKDSFVPAFFRNSVLNKLNKAMKGKLSAHATTSDRNLINANSNVNILMKGSPLLKEASELIQSESPVSVDKMIGEHYMSYRPMVLKASCTACHNHSGVKQQVGEYGGALIIDIKLN